jgi:hypothetical protein
MHAGPVGSSLLRTLALYARTRFPRPTTVVRALLDVGDAEAVRAEVLAAIHRLSEHFTTWFSARNDTHRSVSP